MAEEQQGQEKTEEATPRKLEKAREEGQVARSRELNSFAIVTFGALAAIAMAPKMGLGIARLGGWMFVGGVLLAVPAVASLLIVNLAFGVMNRSAPQLNVFALGFPFSLIFGLVIIWFLLSGWTDVMNIKCNV